MRYVAFAMLALFSAFGTALFTAESLSADTVIPPPFHFERTLWVGARGSDVRYLQTLLNRDSDTAVGTPGLPGSSGNETDFFGAATRRAVVKFQEKYAAEVLKPAGLTRGTGFVGSFTIKKLNSLLENARGEALEVPPPEVPLPPRQIDAAPKFSFDELNSRTREALVNIICTSKQGGSFNPVSGSGVLVDSRGVILTNAHVGQYFLLGDYPTPDFIDCLIRTGEPARNRYKAKVLYLSLPWIKENAKEINAERATGTGENDFALLLITDSINAELPLPPAFPFLPMKSAHAPVRTGAKVLAAGYPAGFLGGISIQRDLYPSSSVVSVEAQYSFDEGAADVLSIGGSVLAQQGSSGGAVVNDEGRLVGLIVTSSMGVTTSERDLHALTTSHIGRSFKKDTGEDIDSFLRGDLGESVRGFNEKVAPTIRKILTDAIEGD